MMTLARKKLEELIVRFLDGEEKVFEDFSREELSQLAIHIGASRNKFKRTDLRLLALECIRLNSEHYVGVYAIVGRLLPYIGMYDEAEAICLDLFENGFSFSSMAIISNVLKQKDDSAKERFRPILEKIAATGHIYSKSLLLSYKFQHLGVFRYVPLLTCRIFYTFQQLVIFSVNPSDPRVETILNNPREKEESL